MVVSEAAGMIDVISKRRADALDCLVAYVPEVLERAEVPIDATLFAALLGTAAMAELGYRTALLPAAVGVYNRSAADARERGLPPEHWPGSAYERTSYHLLFTVDRVAAVDLTAGQFARADVPASAGWFECDERFLLGVEPVHVTLGAGARLAYRAVADDRRWQEAERKLPSRYRRQLGKMAKLVAVQVVRMRAA